MNFLVRCREIEWLPVKKPFGTCYAEILGNKNSVDTVMGIGGEFRRSNQTRLSPWSVRD